MDIAKIAEHLEKTGYIILEKPLADELMAGLLSRCQHDDPARFHAAHVGRGADKKLLPSVRSDVIDWLDADNTIDQTFLACMEGLRQGLNATLFLGLFDYECHYAIYEAGDGYARHSDVLVGKRNRILTTVLYLNESWQPGDGGELVIYEPTGDGIVATVNPTFGKMVIFLSDSFPHEVLISHTTRRSIAGWFRASGS